MFGIEGKSYPFLGSLMGISKGGGEGVTRLDLLGRRGLVSALHSHTRRGISLRQSYSLPSEVRQSATPLSYRRHLGR